MCMRRREGVNSKGEHFWWFGPLASQEEAQDGIPKIAQSEFKVFGLRAVIVYLATGAVIVGLTSL